ncbi:unnamed protein product [Adineta ricciae]|uniref:Uncharacterized protein n=1 Tax=Adineta ricciae TaxID=249248 RepID=A0A813PMI4_ADIRI|nr:unnamed protein product [Adineta ricciae]CAF0805530.1 unnamed protein product [Adineta ricciae]
MSLNFLHNTSSIKVFKSYEKKNSWFEWFDLRRRKPNSEEEINEIHDLILNVYESMDDQARAVLLSLSKIIQDEDGQFTLEEKIQAIVTMGHSLCCAHTQVKNSMKLYSKLFIRALSHQDSRMRLAAMIAIAETAIDNLSFQMNLHEHGIIPKLFEIMKTSMPHAGRTVNDMNEHSKLVAWSCYTIINICANCMPNTVVLQKLVQTELEVLADAVQLEIWSYIWRENYAKTIVEFVNNDSTSSILFKAVSAKSYPSKSHHAQSSTTNVNDNNNHQQRCAIL